MSNLIKFEVMGLDDNTSEFLNWALKHRDNLEWLEQMKMLELRSASATIHFDDLGKINVIEPHNKIKR